MITDSHLYLWEVLGHQSAWSSVHVFGLEITPQERMLTTDHPLISLVIANKSSNVFQFQVRKG